MANNLSNSFPDIMIESELIQYLRIPEISKSNNYHNVIEHLKRFRGLPSFHLCNREVFIRKVIDQWLEEGIFKRK